MVFSSFEFLFRFLPVFLVIYYVTPRKWKNLVLFAASIGFYTVGEAEYVLLLLASVLVNYFFGRVMYRTLEEGRGKKQLLLLLAALGYDFGMLFFYKYSGRADRLPLGISFYTFQSAAYIIDVYRGGIPAEKSLVKFGTYLTMFPQLVAGPIINYSEVRLKLNRRVVTLQQFEDGLKLLVIGLASKVIIADRIGMLWNNIRGIGFESISTTLAWMGAFAYSIQLYFDFLGYSLMAMGLGAMLGFEIPRNFFHPYISKSVSEFWRRWHITLGRWFRDYVYIPLGGNRKGKRRTMCNLLAVWALTALWHGASANYLIWGASLLVLLVLEKLFFLPYLEKSKVMGHLYLLFVVPLTWVVFAVPEVKQIGVYFTRLFPFFGTAGVINQQDYLRYLKDFLPLFLLGVLFATPYPAAFYKVVQRKWLGNVLIMGLLALSLYYLAISTNNPFLYFNF